MSRSLMSLVLIFLAGCSRPVATTVVQTATDKACESFRAPLVLKQLRDRPVVGKPTLAQSYTELYTDLPRSVESLESQRLWAPAAEARLQAAYHAGDYEALLGAVLESAAELANRVNADPVFKTSSLYSERAVFLEQVGRMGANYLSFDFGGKVLRFKVDRWNWDSGTSLVDSVDYESYPEDASDFRVWASSRAEQVRQIAKDRLLDGETIARIEGRLAAAEDPAQTNDLLRLLVLSRASNEACGSLIP